MELAVFDQFSENVGSIEVLEEVFSRPYNGNLVQQLVVRHQANMRMGSRAQKTRSEVSFSTRKPWKQKGTGRARAGMRSSPIWRGGGRAFPSSSEENFSKKINKKMYRVGMSCIYSELIRTGRLRVLDNLEVSSPKTKEFLKILSCFDVKNALFCIGESCDNLILSSRNIVNIKVVLPREVNPVTLIKHHNILLTKKALLMVQEELSC